MSNGAALRGRQIRLGTRGSALATTQSGHIREWVQLKSAGDIAVETIIIKTEGDSASSSLSNPSRPGVFVSALRDALLANEVDFIVHSFKDLPSKPHEGITLVAVPPREDSRDVLASASGLGLAQLPAGAKVGTSSPRRAARIRALRPDLVVAPIRGNIDTRLGKVKSGEYDAAILAAAGLARMGWLHEATEFLTHEQLLPAPAQGALAIEVRSTDTELIQFFEQLNDDNARLVTTAERAVLVGVGASCTTAIGAAATFELGFLKLTAELSDPDTGEQIKVSGQVESISVNALADAEMLGLMLARQILATPIGQRLAGQGG